MLQHLRRFSLRRRCLPPSDRSVSLIVLDQMEECKATRRLPRSSGPDPSAPPLLLELVLPFLPTAGAIRSSQCSRETLRVVRATGEWQRRAAVDFGVDLETSEWDAYLTVARGATEQRSTAIASTAAWREYCSLRLAHYTLQVALCAWGHSYRPPPWQACPGLSHQADRCCCRPAWPLLSSPPARCCP